MPPPQAQELLGVDLKQAGARDRADRVGPLGAVEAESGPLPAGDHHRGDLAGGQGLLAAFGRPSPRGALGVGLRNPIDLHRPDLVWREGHISRNLVVMLQHEAADQVVEPIEVQRLDL